MAKVVQFSKLGGPEVLEVVDAEIASPAPNEVQIAMRAAGLNRAELLFMQGAYLVQPNLPGSRLGFEGSGEIVSVGSHVTDWKAGDRVAILPDFDQTNYGVLGERVNVPERALFPIPDDKSFIEAAAFWLAFGTAYGMMVVSGGLRPNAGQSVVLTGASSSVGTAAFQVARAHGATTIATTRGPEKVEALRSAGADHVIVTSTENVAARLRALTSGRGFDLACDAVSGSLLDALAAAAAPEATIVEYGLLSGENAALPVIPMLRDGLSVTGFILAARILEVLERRRAMTAHLLEGWREGRYVPVIDRTFAFDQLQNAYAHMASNTQIGKIVVKF